MLSLKYPISIVPSDTLSIGLNGGIMRGFCPKTLLTTESLADDEIIGSSVTIGDDDDDDETDVDAHKGKKKGSNHHNPYVRNSSSSVGRNQKRRYHEVIERQLEIGFENKESQVEWIDALIDQYQLLSGI
jgi:hypothetical protein